MRIFLAVLTVMFLMPLKSFANDYPIKTVWLEPARFGGSFREQAFTVADINIYVERLKSIGFDRMVIAYSTLNNAVLFDDNGVGLNYYYYNHGATPPYSTTSTQINTSTSQSQTLSDGFVIEALVDAADQNNMDVILGLSSAGDKSLLFDYATFLENGGNPPFTSMKVSHGNVSIYNRIFANNLFNMNLADLMVSKFGDKIDGFYLTQEASCIDQAIEVHWNVIAQHIKTNHVGKEIWVSPVPTAEVCTSDSQTYAQYINEYASPTGEHKVPPGEPSANDQPAIDIFAYQDAVGAASLNNGGNAAYWYDLNYLNQTARQEKIDRNIDANLPGLKSLHAKHSSVPGSYFINLEAWAMNGSCSTGVGGGGALDVLKYGCPFAANYSRYQEQLAAYETHIVSGEQMFINAGGLLFDFTNRLPAGQAFNGNVRLLNPRDEEGNELNYVVEADRADAFTSGYIANKGR